MSNSENFSNLVEENKLLQEQIFQLECLVGQQEIEISKLNGAYVDLQNRVQELETKLKAVVSYIKSQQNQTLVASEAEETPPPHY
ncbi:SlyX family protein [Psittacicella gerlachiana]|uniref:Protein SlyX homolog n=1 Tax=Psittacicella gerlachiana TaxID=2028574 RepID=A0A3A1Y7V4_9GAMM|nr:SlyX family protein [Psittacicella gerlachiana]RIY34302.1 hypothetical protein CKF59_05630 [Psittacicella gerlachiana]